MLNIPVLILYFSVVSALGESVLGPSSEMHLADKASWQAKQIKAHHFLCYFSLTITKYQSEQLSEPQVGVGSLFLRFQATVSWLHYFWACVWRGTKSWWKDTAEERCHFMSSGRHREQEEGLGIRYALQRHKSSHPLPPTGPTS